MVRLLKYIWAAPCSLFGLGCGLFLLLIGGSVRQVSGILEFSIGSGDPIPFFPFGAVTFGHVVLGLNEPVLKCLRVHELEHVRQYEVWGILFFLAYPASGLWQLLRGRNPYWHNYFEIQARQRSERSGSGDSLRGSDF
ncbi:MAG: signal peptide prediction [Nitrosomonas sp.]|nr:signal peptide prediction [Nitrosomonas sp.]MDL1864195.1 signal peptide prediction [Betaproteobacteria bacterium PRO5]